MKLFWEPQNFICPISIISQHCDDNLIIEILPHGRHGPIIDPFILHGQYHGC